MLKKVKLKFPVDEEVYGFEEFFSSIVWARADSYHIMNEELIETIEVKFEDKYEENYFKNIRKAPFINDFKVFEKDKDHVMIYMVVGISELEEHYPVGDIIKLNEKGFLSYEGGYYDGDDEFIEILCEDNIVNQVIQAFKEYNVQVLKIEKHTKEERLFDDLTSKQLEILLLAYKNGYYEVPRDITLKEISEMVGVDKSVVSEHLRKAERKVLDEIFRYPNMLGTKNKYVSNNS